MPLLLLSLQSHLHSLQRNRKPETCWTKVCCQYLALLTAESHYPQAEQLLQKVVSSGWTYEQLLDAGMHPKFLDVLFSRLNISSSPASPSSFVGHVPHLHHVAPQLPTSSIVLPPQGLVTVVPPPVISKTPTPTPQPTSLLTDVEQFLHTLEPAISSSNVGIQADSKKRPPPDVGEQPPKRRAFGLVPPKQLFIDVSDDDSDEEEYVDTDQKGLEPAPQPQGTARVVKIPDRPPLNQKVHFFTSVLIVGCDSRPSESGIGNRSYEAENPS